MALEIIGEAAEGLLRIIGRVLFEVFFEFLLKGAGYVICRCFGREVDPDGAAAALVGLLFWIAVGCGLYLILS